MTERCAFVYADHVTGPAFQCYSDATEMTGYCKRHDGVHTNKPAPKDVWRAVKAANRKEAAMTDDTKEFGVFEKVPEFNFAGIRIEVGEHVPNGMMVAMSKEREVLGIFSNGAWLPSFEIAKAVALIVDPFRYGAITGTLEPAHDELKEAIASAYDAAHRNRHAPSD